MKCILCEAELISAPDLMWLCPTKIEGREDSHYQYQSKLTWSAEVIIAPPFWLKSFNGFKTTDVYKYPFYPERKIQSQPDWSTMITRITRRMNPKELIEYATRLKNLLVYL